MTTGELRFQQQLSGLSDKVSQIERSLGTGGVVMQVKSELGSEYQKVIENANGGISNILIVFSLLIALIGGSASRYINKLTKQVEKIEENIKEKEENIKSLVSAIESTKTDVDNFIKVQDEKIFKAVYRHIIENYFSRLERNPEDFNNLKYTLSTLDEEEVGSEKKYFNILKKVDINKALLYQYFPVELFLDEILMNDWYGIGRYSNYPVELVTSTRKIINYYKENSLNVDEKLQTYKNFILSLEDSTSSKHIPVDILTELKKLINKI